MYVCMYVCVCVYVYECSNYRSVVFADPQDLEAMLVGAKHAVSAYTCMT